MNATAPPLTVDMASLPPMTFDLPEGMHAIEISADAEERAEVVRQFVRDVYPQGEEPLREALNALYAETAEGMLAGGVAFFGIGLYEIEGGGVAHCSLTLSVFESGSVDQEVVAQGIRATLGTEPLNDVTWLDLPCGPAVSAISLRRLVIDGRFTRSGTDEELVMGQFQVHIPFGNGPYTAVFTLDTASMEQWEEFTHAVAGIVGTVAFPAVSDGGISDGGISHDGISHDGISHGGVSGDGGLNGAGDPRKETVR
ncbi:hypothetical protein AB0N81_26520 [Streptomyces sp. NPDC093510]|uniref:hypothetical protein n=1 Tax=Streptomyces sp. NPDC093510 TaxID=3155199 RepID=UPI00341D395A